MSTFLYYIVVVHATIVFFCSQEFQVFGDKIEESIYQKLAHFTSCVRLLNATHQIGCTSKRKGNVGVVHAVFSDEDFEWLLNEGKHAPYVPLFTVKYFTADRFQKLIDAGKVSGALVISQDPPESGYSPENPCPSDNFGVYNGHKDYSCSARGKKAIVWNGNGSSMSYRDYDVPVFTLVNGIEIIDLYKCYEKYNKPVNGTNPEYPLCAVEMQNFMFAAKDTPTCMRKNDAPTFTEARFCDALGDYNVWGTLFPMIDQISKDDVVLATAKLDSSSFFHKLVPGGDNDASGVIALLAAADALGNLKRTDNGLAPPDLRQNEKHIMFSFFQGEVWDYIGSSRMVYDMMNGNFPSCKKGNTCTLSKVNLSNIAYYLELNQVAFLDNGALWAHSDPLSAKNVGTKVAKMFHMLERIGKSFNLSIKNASPENDQPLPPASFQRFLKKSLNIPGLVITDHKKNFTNKFYNSRFDSFNLSSSTLRSNLVTQLTDLGTTVANHLYELAYNKTNKNITARRDVVNNLLTCFLETANCLLFRDISTKENVEVLSKQATYFPRYVGPFEKQNGQYLAITKMTKLLLSYFTGMHIHTNKSCTDKTGNYALNKMVNDSICVNATVYTSPALSPAFLLKDYASTEYSTWAESRWAVEMNLRMFLIADPSQEIITLVVGIILTVISGVVTVFIYRNADKLFTPDNDVLVINDVQ